MNERRNYTRNVRAVSVRMVIVRVFKFVCGVDGDNIALFVAQKHVVSADLIGGRSAVFIIFARENLVIEVYARIDDRNHDRIFFECGKVVLRVGKPTFHTSFDVFEIKFVLVVLPIEVFVLYVFDITVGTYRVRNGRRKNHAKKQKKDNRGHDNSQCGNP